jgi:hypothetical protein
MLPPSIYLDFADATYLDPRLVFTRASAGSYADRLGVLRYRPAGSPRFWTNPGDGSPYGLLLENAATNLLLWSEDFTQAVWTPTALTVTSNATTAPDGSVNGDALAATAATAVIAQSATVPANSMVSFSVFVKPFASNWVSISLSDGSNVVSAWFNLATGAAGGTVLGAGTLTYQWSSIQPWGNGWYRCGVQARSNTITSVTASISPCAADRTPPTTGNSAYAFGAMLTAEGTNTSVQRQSSYIATAAATATRAADDCPLPYANIHPSAFNPNEGTYFIDWMVPFGTWFPFQAPMFGFANSTGSDTCLTGITVGQNGLGNMVLAVQTNLVAGGVNRGQAASSPSFAFETPIKIAARYSRTALLGHSVNGAAVVSAAAVPAVMPALPTNFTLHPFVGWTVTNALYAIILRRFLYFPRYLSADQMQQITA